MQSEMMKRASELLADGTVVRVLGWKNGEFVYDPHRLCSILQKLWKGLYITISAVTTCQVSDQTV